MIHQISDFYNKLLKLDGLWIDMNEISNSCNGECNSVSHEPVDGLKLDPNNPPYKINNQGSTNPALNVKTLNMDAVHHGNILEYNAHNLFGMYGAL